MAKNGFATDKPSVVGSGLNDRWRAMTRRKGEPAIGASR